jgi:hypothetical protein
MTFLYYLGYGDLGKINIVYNIISISYNIMIYLGYEPFYSDEMRHVKTPNIQKMASNGLTMKNFHTASPICSPARASIMLGLFPWRLGLDFIYAGDLKKDGSVEMHNEQLPLVKIFFNNFIVIAFIICT